MKIALSPADHVDALISRQLPSWLLRASPDRLTLLHNSLSRQQRARHALAPLLAAITPLDTFAAPLLAQALFTATGRRLDVHRATITVVWRIRVNTGLQFVQDTTHSFTQSLLAAALHNFDDDEVEAGSFTGQSHLYDETGARLDLAPHEFAQLCRTLDLGRQYQALIAAQLTSVQGSTRAQGLFEDSLRSEMAVAVRQARLKDEIDEDSYLQLLPVISPTPVLPSDRRSVAFQQLRLLGKSITDCAVAEVRSDRTPAATVEGVIAYLPADPHGAVRRFTDWSAFYTELGRRFRQPGYPAYFQRFIAERDRVEFSAKLKRQLAADRSSTALVLDGRTSALSEALITHLGKARIAKIVDDASVLAISTAQADRTARATRLKGYEQIGVNLLNLAAFFSPGLSLVMLGLAALELANDVYEGYEDWQLGDREGALEHLFSVAETVALTGTVAVGGVLVGKLLKRSGFVDGLQPIRRADDQARLCDPGLEAYALDDPGGVEGELVEHQGQHWLRLADRRYRVEQGDGGAWQICHPREAGRYKPQLTHNGEGGWRHLLEQPRRWQGQGLLLRRFGREWRKVPDALAQTLLRITGLDEARLRQLHLENAPAPSRLGDALDRYQLHEQASAELFEQRYAALQGTGDAASQLLRRHFPGLSGRGAAHLAALADSQERAVLSTGKVPLALAEQARWLLREGRLDRACAGFEQAAAVNDDTVRLALGLIDTLAPWPSQVAVEVRDASLADAIVARRGPKDASASKGLSRGVQGYLAVDASGNALSSARADNSLFEALLLLLDDGQKAALSDSSLTATELARVLAVGAAGQREASAELIGLVPLRGGFQPPMRLADGRLGYPLGGAGAWEHEWVKDAVRNNFPDFTEQEVDDYVDQLVRSGVDVWTHFLRQPQLAALRRTLLDWVPQGVDTAQIASRQRVAEALIEAVSSGLLRWRGGYAVAISAEPIGSLPLLPLHQVFGHVTSLSLRNMGLRDIPDTFLSCFPGLRRVDLSDNQLTEVPADIWHLPHLNEVNLAGNLLSAESHARLASAFPEDEAVAQTQPATPTEEQVPQPGPTRATAREAWLQQVDQANQARRQAQWDKLAEHANAQDFIQLLSDLRGTDDYAARRAWLARRVWRMVESCEQHAQLRATVFDLAASSRGRTASSRFDWLEVQVLATAAVGERQGVVAETELVRLGRSLFRLGELDSIAERDILERAQAGQELNAAAIRQTYRARLATVLELPVSLLDVPARDAAAVTSLQLVVARTQVLVAEQGERLAASLNERLFWREHLRRTYPGVLQPVEHQASLHRKTLEQRLRSGRINAVEFAREVHRVQQQQHADTQRLMLRLSREALARYLGRSKQG
ncbi:dermonecrotic toxin domain-containing protein [Pseudomonas rubra]|uniref:RING-type E3 ubiquitin transferase n=1 Tax=Pseudomonas rubra TaxID=2942627 RepID=A0ABT5PDN6_9PSED|nr:DUF6543 domain-containing protein [Pseudomonas rubra]MDD1016425.1 hypothetical protein [Pseudomonas rubra]MDD1036554.1 hypothetical protein [Pseudomonas rubra]MDD1156534.1 hypothetical protein [Pseudomonas rubra]